MQITLENAAKTDLLKSFDVILKLRPQKKMSDAEFFDFCRKFSTERIERTAEGEIVIMPSGGFMTSVKNAKIGKQLSNWSDVDGRGLVTDSSGGFILPNGAINVPDAAWISVERAAQISADNQEKFLPLCPDFVIELTSPSDSLKGAKEKMVEYIENGAQLGWLVHRKKKQIFVYRSNADVEVLENPEKVSGEPLLTGFELDLREIW